MQKCSYEAYRRLAVLSVQKSLNIVNTRSSGWKRDM